MATPPPLADEEEDEDKPATCRLLALPAELREMIFTFVCADTEIVIHRRKLATRTRRTQLAQVARARYFRQSNLGILLVNSQVHNEAINIYHKNLIIRGQIWLDPARWYSKLPFSRRIQVSSLRQPLIAVCSFPPAAVASMPKAWKRDWLEIVRTQALDEIDRFEAGMARASERIRFELSMVDADDRIVWVSGRESVQRFHEETLQKLDAKPERER